MRKRSKYRPGRILQNPLEFVISGMRPVRDLPGVYLDVQLRNRAALDSVRTGTATKADIDMLVGAFNITEALALGGHGKDWLEEIRQGQNALLTLSRRGVERGMRFIMTAKEWELLKLIMDLHEEQLCNVTVYDIEMAHNLVVKLISQGKAQAIVQPAQKGELK
jgi:hypothetical protein